MSNQRKEPPSTLGGITFPATAPADLPVVQHEVTVLSADGNWKAVMRAWRHDWRIFKSVGGEVDVYQKYQVADRCGHCTTVWIKAPVESIYLIANYEGNIQSCPGTALDRPGCVSNPNRGSYQQRAQASNSSHAELTLWAAGAPAQISAGGPQAEPAGAVIDVDHVTIGISVTTPSGALSGTVATASTVASNLSAPIANN